MAAGASPNVMSSARESSSFPMGEETCSRRAVIPSKKSNVAPNTMKSRAAMLIDLYNVSVLPRCFLIDEDHKILMKTENGIEIKQTLENLFED